MEMAARPSAFHSLDPAVNDAPAHAEAHRGTTYAPARYVG